MPDQIMNKDFKCLRRPGNGFTLIEFPVVLAIFGILTATLVPIFLSARRQAHNASCQANEHQLGLALALYAQDYDDLFPFAVNPADKAHPDRWSDIPAFASLIPQMPQLHQVVRPYVDSSQVFRCPSDTGLRLDEPFPGWRLTATPSSYAALGTSYFYHTRVAVEQTEALTFQDTAHLILLSDAGGDWHGRVPDPYYDVSQLHYNVLFADGHVKNLNL